LRTTRLVQAHGMAAKSKHRPATPLDLFGRRKEILGKINRAAFAVRFKTHPVPTGDVGESAGDISPADEDDAFDLRPDRGKRRPGAVAAIEE
jgi:hypothetical protein